VVGLGIIGARSAGDRDPSGPDRATASTAASGPADARALTLDRPAGRDEIVTTSDIVVRGRAGMDVTRIRVTLESRGGKILASDWIDRVAGGGETFAFEARFEATTARPAGTMWVTATALSSGGIPIDAIRRRFQLGAIRDAHTAAIARDVVLRGRVAKTLGDVRIVLQARDGTQIASASIDPTGHGHAGWVPFESRITLPPGEPSDRPTYVVAVDGAGRPIEPVRQPFSVRLFLFIPASSGPASGPTEPVHTTGEDGVMGGIPFGTNFVREP
jgi:hypothetical protein